MHERLVQVLGTHEGRSRKVGDGARNAGGAMQSPHRQAELTGSRVQQRAERGSESGAIVEAGG